MCYACGHRLHEESDAEEVSESENESETPCPACGTMISADAIMCYACGHRLGGEDDKGAKKAPVSVKKLMKQKVISAERGDRPTHTARTGRTLPISRVFRDFAAFS